MDRRSFLVATSAILAQSAFAQTGGSKVRSALVIGNVSYSPLIGTLRNPGNDTREVGKALKRHGFDIYGGAPLIDANRDKLMSAVRGFSKLFESGDPGNVGFVYFSGHGASHETNGNHIFPLIDWPLEKGPLDESIWDNAISLTWLMDALPAAPAPQIVCIDACRNTLNLNSAKKALAGSGSTFSGIRGINRTDPLSPANMIVSFSTWEGQTASDGSAADEVGPYARALTAQLNSNAAEVRDLFEDVRLQVIRLTGNEQEPMTISRLNEDSVDLTIHSGAAPNAAANARAPKAMSHALVFSTPYDSKPDLKLPGAAKDSALIGSKLKQCGFDLTISPDTNRTAFTKSVKALKTRMLESGPGSIAVLYFNGYGGSMSGDNLLFPEKALEHVGTMEMALEAVRISDMMETLKEASPACVILILDCAKADLNFATKQAQAEFVADPQSDENFLIIFGAQPGDYALRKDGRSIFTRVLADAILSDERRSIQQLMADVKQRVLTETENEQKPWYQIQVDKPVYFRRPAEA